MQLMRASTFNYAEGIYSDSIVMNSSIYTIACHVCDTIILLRI